MNDLGGGVYADDSDAQADLGGHDDHRHPHAAGVPVCPLCTGHDVQRNNGRAGGWICWGCMTVFTAVDGEWAAMKAARGEYEKRPEKKDDDS